MASEEDADIDEIEKELARVEEQIQELERDSEEPPEPEAPDPEPDDVEAPEPEEAFEGEPDVDEDPGLLGTVLARLREARNADEGADDQLEDEPDSHEPQLEEEASPEGSSEDAETEASEETDEPEEGSGLAFWRPSDEDPEEGEDANDRADNEPDADEASPEAATDEALETETPPDDEAATEDDQEEGSGVLGGVLGRIGSDDEEAATAEANARPVTAAHGHARQAPPPTGPTAVAGRAHPAPPGAVEAAENDEDDGTRASALLARFQGGGSGDPDPEEGAEDDDGGLLVPVLVALLLLAGIAAAAYVLFPSDGDGDLSANLVADAFTNDEGRYVATTGQPLLLDASASGGDVEEYVWDFDDGSQETTSEPTVEHAYQQRGSYTVEVTVRSSGGEDRATIDVLVIDAPTAEARILVDGEPAAQPSTIGNNVFIGDEVTLDGTASTADAEHTLTSYSWDVDGDGEPEATGREAQLGFEGTGAWAVNLTVRDDLGNEDTATRLVHVSDRLVDEGSLGPSTTEPDSENYTVAVDEARLGARPVQLDIQLTYNASGGDDGDLPVQPEVDTDLDLNVTDPDGNEYEVEDDDGQGEETLTLPAEEFASLGDWTITVSQDNQNAGTASEAEYELVVEVVY